MPTCPAKCTCPWKEQRRAHWQRRHAACGNPSDDPDLFMRRTQDPSDPLLRRGDFPTRAQSRAYRIAASYMQNYCVWEELDALRLGYYG